MTLSLSVDIKHAIPVYEQIRSQFEDLIGSGHLAVGARLPTVRALAADLGIAINTVSRAYTELESSGLITTRRRTGTVVAPHGQVPTPEPVLKAARQFAKAARAAGLSDEAALSSIRSALREQIAPVSPLPTGASR